MIPGLRSEVRGRGRAWDDDLNLDDDLDDEPVSAPRTDVCGGVTSLDGFDLGPVKKTVVGNGLDNVVERLVYGEEVEDATDKNLKGRLYQHFDQAGRMRVPFYDLHGQVGRSQRRLRTQYKAESNWPDSGGWNGQLEAEAFQTTYQYDALARVEQVNHPDGSKVRPRYHQSGRLRRVRVMAAGESTWSNYVVNIKYSAKSQRETIIYGNGTRTDYRYDPATFRLEYLRTKRTGDDVTLQRITYVYDPVGNVVRITDSSHEKVFGTTGPVSPVQNYTYDALYRLTRATGRMHNSLGKNAHVTQADFKAGAYLNDITQLSEYARQYMYDHAGNLHTLWQTGANPFTRYVKIAADSNRAVLNTDDGSTEIVATPAEIAEYFDANGNQKKLDHLAGVTWTYRDSISSAAIIERESDPDDVEYYVYDAAGQRARKVKETFGYGEATEYVSEKIYLGGVEIKRERSIDLSTMTVTPTLERADLHVMDDKQRIAIVNRWTNDMTGGEAGSVVDPANPATYVSKQRYQYGNHLGSASLELDDAGLVISYEEYFPYGGTSIIAGNSQTEVKLKEYRYTGKERDDSTGFYYYGQRYYAPWVGRWLSADPAGPVDGLNLYEYVSGNPVRMVDPEGMQEEVPQGHREWVDPNTGKLNMEFWFEGQAQGGEEGPSPQQQKGPGAGKTGEGEPAPRTRAEEAEPEPTPAGEPSREQMQEALEEKLEGELRLVGQLSGRPAAAPMERLTVAFVPGGAVATGTLVGGAMAYGAVAAGPSIGAAATKAVEVTTAAAVKATAMATAAGAAATAALQRIAQPAQRVFQALQGRATEAVRGAQQFTVTFGRNANQVEHAFRHTDKLGLSRTAVQEAIQKHLLTVADKIPSGLPLNQVIEVGGKQIQYSAFRLLDGSINVGRIHGVP